MRCVKSENASIRRHVNPERRVLAIVGDTQVGLWIVRSLARGGLSVHAVVNTESGQSAYSRFADSAWILDNNAASPKVADEIKSLVEIVGAGSVMPVSEGFHNALIKVRERFEPEIHVFSPSRESFDKATDKDYMQSLCLELDVPVARGTRLDLLMAEGGSSLELPLVLRTRQQNVRGEKAPWKAAYAETKEDLYRLYDEVKGLADNVIVQEYHPGVEDHVQILMHNGKCVMAGDYIGEHHMPLAGGVTVQRVSCRHEGLIRDAVKLLKAIHFEGIAGVQFHYDIEKDKYIFLEINPRFSGGLPTVIMSGFQAPFRLWQSHFEPENLIRDKYKLGLRTRILGGDANWMLGMLRGDPLPPGQKRPGRIRTVAEFLWHSGPWTRDDSFMWTDPKPFFVDLRQMIRKLGSQAFDIIS